MMGDGWRRNFGHQNENKQYIPRSGLGYHRRVGDRGWKHASCVVKERDQPRCVVVLCVLATEDKMHSRTAQVNTWHTKERALSSLRGA